MKRTLLFLTMMLMAMVTMAQGTKTLVMTTEPEIADIASADKIKKALRDEKGVKGVEANAVKQRVKVLYNPTLTCPDSIFSAMKKIGYTATAKKSFIEKSKEKIAAAAESCSENATMAYNTAVESLSETYKDTKEKLKKEKQKRQKKSANKAEKK